MSGDKFESLAETISAETMRATALKVLEPIAAANAKGLFHPDEIGSPSKEKLAFMLLSAATVLEALSKTSAGPDAVEEQGEAKRSTLNPSPDATKEEA